MIHFRAAGLPAGVHITSAGRVTGYTETTWISARRPPGVAHLRADRDRLLLAHLVPWRRPTRIISEGHLAYDEWFTRGSVSTSDRPTLELRHVQEGGHVVGSTLTLRDEPWGMDGVFEVLPGGLGDGVLDLVDSNPRLPISIAFRSKPNGFRVHDGPTPGVERTAVTLIGVAIVESAAYRDAYVVGRTTMVAAARAAAPMRRR